MRLTPQMACIYRQYDDSPSYSSLAHAQSKCLAYHSNLYYISNPRRAVTPVSQHPLHVNIKLATMCSIVHI